jgi:glycosyltransferase involved in cell wall biosynthesis
MTPPKVSIIIPAYNAAPFLPQALESILAQTFRDFEIILIDDGAIDETDLVISKYHSWLNVIRQSNQGPGAARNAGLRVATGEYLVFLDADDCLMPHKIEIQVAFLDQHPHIDIVYSDGFLIIQNPDGKEQHILFSKSRYLNKNLASPEKSLRLLALKNAFPLHAAMLRSSVARQLNGFDDTRTLSPLADWDFWYRAAQNYNFFYQDEVLVLYRVIDTSISRNIDNLQRATHYLEDKIEASDAFVQFPPYFKSTFYLYSGLRDLKFNDPHRALSRFSASLQSNPWNIPSQVLFLITKASGKGSVTMFRLISSILISRI